jgi:hypothetical protein
MAIKGGTDARLVSSYEQQVLEVCVPPSCTLPFLSPFDCHHLQRSQLPFFIGNAAQVNHFIRTCLCTEYAPPACLCATALLTVFSFPAEFCGCVAQSARWLCPTYANTASFPASFSSQRKDVLDWLLTPPGPKYDRILNCSSSASRAQVFMLADAREINASANMRMYTSSLGGSDAILKICPHVNAAAP